MKTNFVLLLLVLAAGQTPKAAAQSPGTFTATGNMTTRPTSLGRARNAVTIGVQ